MRRQVLFCLLLAALLLVGCAKQESSVEQDASTSQPEITAKSNTLPSRTETEETSLPEPIAEEKLLELTINGTVIEAKWEDNETVTELLTIAKETPIVVSTTLYGGFKQVGSLPQSFPRNDVQMTTEPGDIVLYSGNQLVVFFGTNSWRYTKIGHINLSEDELKELLGEDTAVIEIKTTVGR